MTGPVDGDRDRHGTAAAGPPDSLIVAALRRAAEIRPGGWAVRDTRSEISYGELHERAQRQAQSLTSGGVRPGMLVLLEATHDIDYLVAYFSVLAAGARVMPWDPTAGAAEAERERLRYGVDLVLHPAGGGSGDGLQVTGGSSRAARGEWPSALADGRVLLPTSGTGGLPKRAVHVESRLLANARAHADSVGMSGDDTCLVILSPAFGYCHTAQILAIVVSAGRLVFPPRPALPADLARLVAACGVTTTTVVPRQLTPAMVRAFAGSALRQIVMGGSAVTPDIFDRLAVAHPRCEIVQTWGMTEAGPRMTTWRSTTDSAKPGSVGRALAGVTVAPAGADGRVPLLSAAGTHAPLVPGELVVRTPYAMAGYLDAEAETASTLLAPDILRTGDLGVVDDDGYVFITGRVKSLIDVSGKKVSPEEVEAVLLAVPGVAEARALGEPCPQRGEKVVASVVLRPGSDLDQAKISDAIRPQLARYKWPRRIDIVDQIDKTANGKVRRW